MSNRRLVRTDDSGNSTYWNVDDATLNTLATSGVVSNLDDLADVVVSAPAPGQVLKVVGSDFVNAQVAYSEITGTPTIPTVSYRTLSRLHTGYQSNTNQTTLSQNVWTQFAFPSGGFLTSRVSGFTVSGSQTAFTYTGTGTKWFEVSAICNVFSVGGNDRSIQFQWRKNGIAYGLTREIYMRTSDALVITGIGQMQLTTGDVVTPWIQNIENNDSALMPTCSFNFREDPDQVLETP